MANAEPHDNLQNSICLSHHVNARSKARRPSPLKDIIHFMSQEGMISFAGGKRKYDCLMAPSMLRPSRAGLPHPSLFPIHGANFVVSNVSPGRAPESNDESVLELSSTAGSPTLANFLQYGEQNQASLHHSGLIKPQAMVQGTRSCANGVWISPCRSIDRHIKTLRFSCIRETQMHGAKWLGCYVKKGITSSARASHTRRLKLCGFLWGISLRRFQWTVKASGPMHLTKCSLIGMRHIEEYGARMCFIS